MNESLQGEVVVVSETKFLISRELYYWYFFLFSSVDETSRPNTKKMKLNSERFAWNRPIDSQMCQVYWEKSDCEKSNGLGASVARGQRGGRLSGEAGHNGSSNRADWGISCKNDLRIIIRLSDRGYCVTAGTVASRIARVSRVCSCRVARATTWRTSVFPPYFLPLFPVFFSKYCLRHVCDSRLCTIDASFEIVRILHTYKYNIALAKK